METIGKRKLFSFLSGGQRISAVSNYQVRRDEGRVANSFPELVEFVARLSFYNPEHVLLFRGQGSDWKNENGNSTIKPSIFRPERGRGNQTWRNILIGRYAKLHQAEDIIADAFVNEGLIGRQNIVRHRVLRWAILQHYEICDTPLLDVTHSLRVAASFATQSQASSNPVVCVLAIPALGGSVSASSEHGIQTIRLTSICPPQARRPHFQDGYLVGEYPELISFREKQRYAPAEIDFAQRLLAKFRLSPTFWNDGDFPQIPRSALYPDGRDNLLIPIARQAKLMLQQN